MGDFGLEDFIKGNPHFLKAEGNTRKGTLVTLRNPRPASGKDYGILQALVSQGNVIAARGENETGVTASFVDGAHAFGYSADRISQKKPDMFCVSFTADAARAHGFVKFVNNEASIVEAGYEQKKDCFSLDEVLFAQSSIKCRLRKMKWVSMADHSTLAEGMHRLSPSGERKYLIKKGHETEIVAVEPGQLAWLRMPSYFANSTGDFAFHIPRILRRPVEWTYALELFPVIGTGAARPAVRTRKESRVYAR